MSIDRFKIKITNLNESKKKRIPRQLTLEQAIDYVKKIGLLPDLEDGVIRRISRYPSNSFNAALKHIDTIVDQVKEENLKGHDNKEKDNQG